MKRSKRRVGVVIAAVTGLTIVAAGIIWRQSVQVPKAAPNTTMTAARREVDAMQLRGDRDLATDYVAQLKSNNPTAAKQVYAAKIDHVTDVTEKTSLYTQQLTLAEKYKQFDQALEAALAIDAAGSSVMTVSEIAHIYGEKGDKGKQVEYLKKTIAMITQDTMGPEWRSIRADYDAQLQAVEGGQ